MENKVTLEEFKKNVRNASAPHNHKVRNSLGIRDAFLYLQKNKWFNIGQSLKESTFQQIIRGINEQLAFELMEGRPVVFPENMGYLEVRKLERFAYVEKNGKIRSNYYIDWDKTLKLWYEDPEARRNKTLVRDITSKELFIFFYNRRTANYNNKSFMQFKPIRSIHRILGQNIKQGRIDAYMYGYERLH